MTKAKLHYRSVSRLFARRHGEEIFDGYASARRVERLPAVIDREPGEFFAGASFCKEDYEHVRSTLGDSRAFCIGWAIAKEELRDCSSPAHALAELF